MTRHLPAIAAAFIVLLTGIVHGMRTDRWWVSEARTSMAERVGRLPMRAGDWAGEDMPLDVRQVRIAEADAAVSRVYSRTRPGREREEVTLILLSGRAAPMAVHSPDVCFTNIGYAMDGEPRAYNPTVDGERRDSLWQARFAKASDPLPRRVYWGWSDGGKWRAADNPRGEYNRSGGLYKLYLVCALPRPLTPDEPDPAQELLTDLLPEMHRTLALP